jgi:glycosyltransferase involved in cell wall biosynthesis
MKILVASNFALPNTGGLWTYVTQLKRGLEAMGHEVDVFARHPDGAHYYLIGQKPFFENKLVKRVFAKHLAPLYEPYRKGLEDGILRMEMQRYLMEAAAVALDVSGYDLFHTQDIVSTRAISRIKPPHTPLIATIHGYFSFELLQQGVICEKDSPHHRYSLAQEAIGITSADAAILPSQWMKDVFLRDLMVKEKKMHVVPNGMDIEAFVERMEQQGQIKKPAGKRVIACVARLDRLKGHRYLIDALAQVKREPSGEWECWLIGEGPARREIEQQIGLLGLESCVRLLGDRSDVPALLKHADMCVLPSLQENCPYSIMEAQVAGKPVIATEVGGIPEMITPEKTGFLVPPHDSEALAETLLRLLRDPERCRKIGAQAEEWGRIQWSLQTMRRRTMSLYRSVLRQKAREVLRMSLMDAYLRGLPLSPDVERQRKESPVLSMLNLAYPKHYRLPDPAFVQVIRGL